MTSPNDQFGDREESSQDSQPLPPVAAAPQSYSTRLDIQRGRPLSFTFDGLPIEAYEGETIAAALLGSGRRALRVTDRRGEVRGLFCNMGVCFECLVDVDGRTNQRACQHPVSEGMRVMSQSGKSPSEQQT